VMVGAQIGRHHLADSWVVIDDKNARHLFSIDQFGLAARRLATSSPACKNWKLVRRG